MSRLVSRPFLSLLAKQQNINKLKLIQKRNHLHDTTKNQFFWGAIKEEACFAYRSLNYASNRQALEIFAEIGMGFWWYWIGYNCIHHWQHLVGEFVWPEFDKWTDEELGIPPIEED